MGNTQEDRYQIRIKCCVDEMKNKLHAMNTVIPDQNVAKNTVEAHY